MLKSTLSVLALSIAVGACDQRARDQSSEAGREVGRAAKEVGRSVVEQTGRAAGTLQREASEAAQTLRREAEQARREGTQKP